MNLFLAVRCGYEGEGQTRIYNYIYKKAHPSMEDGQKAIHLQCIAGDGYTRRRREEENADTLK